MNLEPIFEPGMKLLIALLWVLEALKTLAVARGAF